jgi:hypothetical protein
MARVTIEDKREVGWDEVENGDEVYIAGDIINNEPTMTYGPHKVHDKDNKVLINGSEKTFYESWSTLFISL